jgi:hypothetical protein
MKHEDKVAEKAAEEKEERREKAAKERGPTIRMVKDDNAMDVAADDVESHRRMGWKLE